MGRKSVLTEAQVQDIIKMRREGLSLRTIGDKHRVSLTTVCKVCNKYAPELVRKSHIRNVTASKMYRECRYRGLVDWMIKNDTTAYELGRRAGVGDGMTIYNMLTGRSDLRKRSIDKVLKHTGLTYEEAFREQ